MHASVSNLRTRLHRGAAAASRCTPAPSATYASAAAPPSVGGTFSHQSALPHLPVPPLDVIVARYLRTVQPVVTPEQFAKAAAAAELFPTQAAELYAELRRRAQSQRNWLEPFWDNGVYLEPRDALPINYNYFLMFRDPPEPASLPSPYPHGTQLARAASLLRAMTGFRQHVLAETLPPDQEGRKVVCMNQYTRLFSHARVAQPHVDALHCYDAPPAGLAPELRHFATQYRTPRSIARHVAVFVDGHVYKLPVTDASGAPLPARDVAGHLARIQASALARGPSVTPIGAFTAMDRASWATVRQRLSADPVNADSLQTIDEAVWVLVLDAFQLRPGSVIGSDPSRSSLSTRFVVGQEGAVNSWFDKHQLIVTADGVAGMLMEHSPGDGLTALRLMDYMHATTLSSNQAHGHGPKSSEHDDPVALARGASMPTADAHVDAAAVEAHVHGALRGAPLDLPAPLAWNFSAQDFQDLAAARRYHTQQCGALLSHSAEHSFGADEIKKSSRVSPDAYVQMAIQLAHHRVHGFPAPTYESTTLRGFAHGRTETTRSCSLEALDFVRAMAAPQLRYASNSKYAHALLSRACEAHVQYAKAAKAAQGVDRPLLGMRNIATEKGLPLPALFTDPCYAASRHWRLSTSHCGSAATSSFGFGPVVSDGYGIGYAVTRHRINYNVTTWRRDSRDTSATALTEAVEAALDDIMRVSRGAAV